MSPTILLPELAELVGKPGERGERWLKANHYRLVAEHGFPSRLPTGWAWSRALVEIWIRNSAGGTSRLRGGPAAAPEPLHPPVQGAAANDDEPTDFAPLDPAVEAARERLIEAQHAYLTRRMGGRR